MIAFLNTGDTIVSTRDLNGSQIGYWKYAKECDYYGAGFARGTKFTVKDKSKINEAVWVRVEIPGSYNSRFLKISGGEFSSNFTKA